MLGMVTLLSVDRNRGVLSSNNADMTFRLQKLAIAFDQRVSLVAVSLHACAVVLVLPWSLSTHHLL
jgi:hypothetical protein